MDRIRFFNGGRTLSYNAPIRDCGGVYTMTDCERCDKLEKELEEMTEERNYFVEEYEDKKSIIDAIRELI